MLKAWMACAVAAFAVLLLVGTVDTADAYKRSGGWNGGGGKFYGGKVYGGGGPKFYGGGPKFYGGSPKLYAGPKIYAGPKFNGGIYGGKFHKGHKHARFHKYRFVGVPLAYYGYSTYDYWDNSCYWLRRRALDSGSSYWWNRYYACIDGYGPY
jgi:hypothetical protein